jgi:hypothetical protein
MSVVPQEEQTMERVRNQAGGGVSRDGTADWSTLALSCSGGGVEVEVEAFRSRSSRKCQVRWARRLLFKQFQACNPIGRRLIWHHFS